jgi:very-short-patch-repair endonuclease
MSPLTVSQYLDPLVFNFDLVIFDEASQLRMEDALGSIFRGKQVIVVGDEQQLPPTHFFDTMDSGEDLDEENTSFLEVVDYESILTRAEAENKIFHPVSLRWHYRSKNEDLIAFSNKNFYNNRLYTFPNPYLDSFEKGVSFIYVPEGMYDRGRSRTNVPEAQRVVNECLKFAKQNPNLSLGVVTFSEPQRQVIQDYLDTSLISKPELINYFSENNPNGEPFIIKNLELIQGDERDAIFISFGYGPDQTNFFSQNFGPLNQEAGRRRLNVAVTRARRMVKVFSSVEPEKLTSDAPGVRLMREYLTLARDGVNALFGNMTTGEEMGEVESPFEESVANKLREKGLEVKSQIGCSGFRIDLGIVDPTNPGKFVLGVECDGATYHSERTARDRDRLRQQVLENLGWHIVRIWSRTWFENPQREIDKILNEVQRYQGKDNPIQENVEKKDKIVCELVHVEKSTLSHELSIQDIYPTKFSEQKKLVECLHSPDDFIVKVIEYEGPKQKEAFLKRIANSMGYARMGINIRSNIEWSISRAVSQRKIACSGIPVFIYPSNNYLATLPKSNLYFRKIDEIPMEECYLAIWLAVIAAGGSIEIDDAFRIAGNLFSFGRITSDISDRFGQALLMTDEIFSMGHSNADSKIILCNHRLGLV